MINTLRFSAVDQGVVEVNKGFSRQNATVLDGIKKQHEQSFLSQGQGQSIDITFSPKQGGVALIEMNSPALQHAMRWSDSIKTKLNENGAQYFKTVDGSETFYSIGLPRKTFLGRGIIPTESVKDWAKRVEDCCKTLIEAAQQVNTTN